MSKEIKKIYIVLSVFGVIWLQGILIEQSVASTCSGSEIVRIYEHNSYGGNCLGLGVGSFDLSASNMSGSTSWNDQASSIRVASGYKVTLYEHSNFTPTSNAVIATGDVSGISPNDWASSIKIETSTEGGGGTSQASYGGVDNPIGTESLNAIISNLSLWLYIFSIPLLSLMLLYGAFLIVTSRGEEEKYAQGKKVIKWGIIGFILVGLSGAIAAIVRSVVS